MNVRRAKLEIHTHDDAFANVQKTKSATTQTTSSNARRKKHLNNIDALNAWNNQHAMYTFAHSKRPLQGLL
jgi:hypothetical protein